MSHPSVQSLAQPTILWHPKNFLRRPSKAVSMPSSSSSTSTSSSSSSSSSSVSASASVVRWRRKSFGWSRLRDLPKPFSLVSILTEKKMPEKFIFVGDTKSHQEIPKILRYRYRIVSVLVSYWYRSWSRSRSCIGFRVYLVRCFTTIQFKTVKFFYKSIELVEKQLTKLPVLNSFSPSPP